MAARRLLRVLVSCILAGPLLGTTCGTPRRIAYTFALSPCPTQPLNLPTKASREGAVLAAERGAYEPVGLRLWTYRLTLPKEATRPAREYRVAVRPPLPGECHVSLATGFLEISEKDGRRTIDDLDYGTELAASLLFKDLEVSPLLPVARRDTLSTFQDIARLPAP